MEVPNPTGDDRKLWRMANWGSDGGRRVDVTVRPCSLFALCSVLVILTGVPLNVGSRKVL